MAVGLSRELQEQILEPVARQIALLESGKLILTRQAAIDIRAIIGTSLETAEGHEFEEELTVDLRERLQKATALADDEE
ncbi:MAG: hypothetical protein WCX61_00910 [Candidatus Peribacteraceae bacterium]|jgi:hypothetical protein